MKEFTLWIFLEDILLGLVDIINILIERKTERLYTEPEHYLVSGIIMLIIAFVIYF